MDQKNAIRLLDNTFNQDFDLDRFSLFVKELFNHFNLRINENIPLRKEYYDYISQMDSLGVYSDPNGDSIEVFAVHLKRTSSRDRARTMQRNLVAKYLKNSDSDAALVAFYGDDPQDWRFSFVKIDYDLVKDEKGNLKIEKDITPAKRYSFLVGKNEPNHTCKRQFINLIVEEDVDPLLEDLEKVFSIEKVTIEFFEKYQKLFIKLKKSLESVISKDEVVNNEFIKRNIPTADFAKKLMGQIVFIYFLQKKGWLGVDKGEKWGNGPRNFLRKLFNKEIVDYDNFFNDILEPLFYEALATSRDDDYYRHFDCKIPFLNGGLFESINDYDWVQTEITLKNHIFEEILDVFDLYNFTIKEDEPLEKEVAVDPEMLGKVFENLLEVEDRKTKGAFYTPREIVHYMCQESLINYLNENSEIKRDDIENFIHFGDFSLDFLIREIIEFGKLRKDREYGLPKSIRENYQQLNSLLQNVKVVDPAVGSGAFPVGMMNEIVKARSILSLLSEEEKSYYNLKLETIRECLYGVDIDASAVDIAKLRFWLSLIVDEEDIEKIDPLPNLDHKIMCGNSLIEEFEGMKLFDEKLLTDVPKDSTTQSTLDKNFNIRLKKSQIKLKELKNLQKLFFKEQNIKNKKNYRNEIERIEWELIEETLKEEGNETAIDRIEEYKNNRSKPFFVWKLYFHDVFTRENPGFDIAIMNPPYLGEKGNKEIFREIKQGFLGKYQQGKMDLFYFFFHLSLNIARNKGQISFITTNYYPTATGGNKLRQDFKNRSTIQRLINFNELKIFESAKGQHNMITLLSKCNSVLNAKNCITKRKGVATPNILQKILNWNDTETSYYEVSQDDLYDGEENYIRLQGTSESADESQSILSKIISLGSTNLAEQCYIHQGLKTNADKITPKHLKKYPELVEKGIKKGEGIFVIKKDHNLLKIVNSEEKRFIKPLFKNSDINKYYTKNEADDFVLFITKKNYINSKHPNIKKHLEQYRSVIQNRAEVEPKGRIPLYSLTRPRKDYMYISDKIIAPFKSKGNTFGYNNCNWYASGDVYFITTKKKNDLDIKYLLGILNSKLYNLWLYKKGKRKGDMIELYQKPLSEIPLIKTSKSLQLPFIKLVDQILEITKDKNFAENKEKRNQIKLIEKQLNNLIYDLYGLSNKEIKIVEEYNKEHFNE